MHEITLAENPRWSVPVLEFQGTPTGIDVSKVCRTGILPQINTGMAGRVAGTGQVGAGPAAQLRSWAGAQDAEVERGRLHRDARRARKISEVLENTIVLNGDAADEELLIDMSLGARLPVIIQGLGARSKVDAPTAVATQGLNPGKLVLLPEARLPFERPAVLAALAAVAAAGEPAALPERPVHRQHRKRGRELGHGHLRP